MAYFEMAAEYHRTHPHGSAMEPPIPVTDAPAITTPNHWYFSPWAAPLWIIAFFLYIFLWLAYFFLIIATFTGTIYGLTLFITGRAPYIKLGDKRIDPRDGGESWPLEGIDLRPRTLSRQDAQRRGAMIFLACWIAFPAILTPMCVESPYPWDYWAYPAAFRTAWRAWGVLWMAITATGGGFALTLRVFQGMVGRPSDAAAWRQSKEVMGRLFHSSSEMWASIVVLGLGFLSLLTGWNVLCYAGRYGIFERHGGVLDFFYCYGYSFGLIVCFVDYIVWVLSFLIGGMLGICITWNLIAHIIHYYRAEESQRSATFSRDFDLNWAQWVLVAFGLMNIAIGSAFTFYRKIYCRDMRAGLVDATESLFKPGNEDHTLNWGVLVNSTGTYNVTMDPYRPLLPPSQSFSYDPVTVEFSCEIMAVYRWALTFKYFLIVTVVYLIALYIDHRRSGSATTDEKKITKV